MENHSLLNSYFPQNNKYENNQICPINITLQQFKNNTGYT